MTVFEWTVVALRSGLPASILHHGVPGPAFEPRAKYRILAARNDGVDVEVRTLESLDS